MKKMEAERITRMMRLGCCACAHLQLPVPAQECHHILHGNKRLGHWYTIPLCRGHHQGDWRELSLVLLDKERVAISDGRKAFTAVYPSERELWERVQRRLKLPTSWPQSKIYHKVVVA
jgi:hypothetical protein